MINREKRQYFGEKILNWISRHHWSAAIFQPVEGLSVDSHFDKHVAWAFKHVYHKPYRDRDTVLVTLNHGIERLVHGVTHTSRAALYVPVWINLYRKLGKQAAIDLTDEDLRLLKIATLLHDACNINEHGGKAGDADSGLFTYLYLTRVLNLSKEKAKIFAEAVANKEPDAQEYFTIKEDIEDIQLECTTIEKGKRIPFSIYQHIIHDADCLDIIRARPYFIAEYLCIFDTIALPHHRYAFLAMAHLICEVRSLIDKQGDTYCHMDSSVKRYYENRHAYKRIVADLHPEKYPLLHTLYTRLFTQEELALMPLVTTTEYNPNASLTDSNITAAMREGRVFARALVNASHYYIKNATNTPKETHAEEDFRKIMRVPGIPTKSSKAARFFKSGFKQRAASMLGFGAGVFYGAGYLVIDPAPGDISHVSSIDANSGFAQKACATNIDLVRIEENLSTLHQSLLRGGDSANIRYFNCAAVHNEVKLDINKVDAFYFCNDRTLSNLYNGLPDSLPPHPHSQLLIAVYLRTNYAKAYSDKRNEFIATYGEHLGDIKFKQCFGTQSLLPIYEYSSTHHFIRQIPEEALSEDALINYWVEACGAYMHESLFKPQKSTTTAVFHHHQNVHFHSRISTITELQNASLFHIKYVSIFGHMILSDYATQTPDCCMSLDFITRLNAAITAKRKDVIDKYQALARDIDCDTDWLRLFCYSGVDLTITNRLNLGLLANAYNGDIESLLTCVTHGIQIEPAVLGAALIQTIAQRDYNSVIALLKHGAPINHRTSRGETPMHIAAQVASVSMVKILSQYGATISLPNDAGFTPLHFSCDTGDLDTTRQLIIEGADIDAGPNQTVTPLCIAASAGKMSLVQLLINHGARISIMNNITCSAIVEALMNHHIDIALYLIGVARSSELNVIDSNNSTELSIAITYGNKEIIKALLEKKCFLHHKDKLIAKFTNEHWQQLVDVLIEINALDKPFTFSGLSFLKFAETLENLEQRAMIDRMTQPAVTRLTH